MPDCREFNPDPSDWYAQLEKFKVQFTPKTTLKKLYTNLQERYLHLYQKHYQTHDAKLTKGSSKPFKFKFVNLADIPLIRRNPDRHAKRIGYQKTKKEISNLKAKKSKRSKMNIAPKI